MKPKDIAELLNEPACEHNNKSKSGCARPKPGSTAGGCAFDGAQIALIPIADVAHIVHGPIACAGSSWDNRGTRSSGPDALSPRHDDRPDRARRHHGPGRKAAFPFDQAGHRRPLARRPSFVYNTCVPALIGDDIEAVCKAADRALGRAGRADRLCRVLWHEEPGQSHRRRRDGQVRDRHPRARPVSPQGVSAPSAAITRSRCQPHRRVQHRGRIVACPAAVRRTRACASCARSRATRGSARCRPCTGPK